MLKTLAIESRVSVGTATVAMILNGLGFSNRQLYLVPQYFANKPVEHLLGAGISAEMLNDDCLGRTLDWLYAQDPTKRQMPQDTSHLAISRLQQVRSRITRSNSFSLFVCVCILLLLGMSTFTLFTTSVHASMTKPTFRSLIDRFVEN